MHTSNAFGAFGTLVERTKQIIHGVLLSAFLLVAVFMLVGFFRQMPSVLRTFDDKKMFVMFGNLLILWTVMELVQAEIMVLRGKKFGIEVLIDVALATVIRKMLISDFSGGTQLAYDLGTLVVLAGVRFLMARFNGKGHFHRPDPAYNEDTHYA